MILKDFIKKYSKGCYRGSCEYLFECEFDEVDGIKLPCGFDVINDISSIPMFIVAVNRCEKAIIIIDSEVSLSIYDTEVQIDAALHVHEKYFKNRFERYLNFRYFCNSIVDLELMEILNAITDEIYEANRIRTMVSIQC